MYLLTLTERQLKYDFLPLSIMQIYISKIKIVINKIHSTYARHALENFTKYISEYM